MPRARLAWPLRLAVGTLLVAGCLPSISDLNSGPLNETFAVSDFFSPSGYMGDGEFFGKLQGTPNEGCKPNASQHRGNCYAFTYLPNDLGCSSFPCVDPWAGVFWVFPSNSWGSTIGHAIDVSKFKQVSFWAAIDGPTPYTVDGNPVPLKGLAGGISPNGQFGHLGGVDYSDGVMVNDGFQIGSADGVTTVMKQFHMPLGDDDKKANCQVAAMGVAANCTSGAADFLIAAFGFALHYPTDIAQCSNPAVDCHSPLDSSMFVNPPPVHIYLDDIVWDTQDPPAP
jgi:hypothetical protein